MHDLDEVVGVVADAAETRMVRPSGAKNTAIASPICSSRRPMSVPKRFAAAGADRSGRRSSSADRRAAPGGARPGGARRPPSPARCAAARRAGRRARRRRESLRRRAWRAGPPSAARSSQLTRKLETDGRKIRISASITKAAVSSSSLAGRPRSRQRPALTPRPMPGSAQAPPIGRPTVKCRASFLLSRSTRFLSLPGP